MNWTDELHRVKDVRNIADIFSSHEKLHLFLTSLKQQLLRYVDLLAATSNLSSIDKHDILETIRAVRCATVLCLGDGVTIEDRYLMQELSILQEEIHLPLMRIISTPLESGYKGRKLQISASRLLCNLVTTNAITSKAVLTSISLCPSMDQISESIKKTVLSTSSNVPPAESSSTISNATKQFERKSLNWVDMILSCTKSGNRDAFAVIVALLHNAIVVVKDEPLVEAVATSSILMATLIRNLLVPSKSLMSRNQLDESNSDEATEWSMRLLERLTRLGYLPQIYTAIGSSNVVTPEHIVLLHCISLNVNEWLEFSIENESPTNPLGSSIESHSNSHIFLSQIYCRIKHFMPSGFVVDTTDTIELSHSLSIDPESFLLSKSAALLSLEILSASLGNDKSSEASSVVRDMLGTKTTLIQDVALDLGLLVDTLNESHLGTKAREIKLTEDQQRWITTYVGLLGNCCFRCRTNQDAIRAIMVPINHSESILSDDDKRNERTALHVLLSCTSLACGCFTLREWTILALRNALEENLENQALVRELEVQQSLHSPELEKMGFKVNVDERGKVNLVSHVTSNSKDA
jgi:Spinocerebellar ataxia type 10 protein domain